LGGMLMVNIGIEIQNYYPKAELNIVIHEECSYDMRISDIISFGDFPCVITMISCQYTEMKFP